MIYTDMKYMFYIYKITNKINNKIYIGKTNNPYQRIHSHLHFARHGNTNEFYKNNGKYNYIHRSITKYGKDNFTFEIIDQNEDEDIIFALEIFYISKYQTQNIKYGYNMTKGGEGASGRKHSENAKQKIREKAIGRLHSTETKNKLSILLSGEGCGHSTLTKEQIPEILRLRNQEKLSYPIIGKMFKVSKTTIREICIGATWKILLNNSPKLSNIEDSN